MLRRGSTLSVLMVLLMVAAVTFAVPSTRAAAEMATGARLVFSADLGEGSEIYTVGVDGTDLRRVTANEVPDAEPVWSPDGTRIAWASGQNGSRQIVVANADGTEARTISTGDSDAVEPAWSPDGAQLAFASDVMRRGELWGTRELFVVDPTTGEEPRRVSDDPLGRGGFTWTSDGRSVIYAGYCEECAGSDLFSVDVETGERVQLVADEETAISPVTRPGTSEVFYLVRDRTIDRALTQVRAIDLTTGEIRKVTAAPSDLDDPTFSPDGQLLTAGRFVCDGPGICVVDLERGIITTAGEAGEATLDFSDGRTIAHPDWHDSPNVGGLKASPAEIRDLTGADDAGRQAEVNEDTTPSPPPTTTTTPTTDSASKAATTGGDSVQDVSRSSGAARASGVTTATTAPPAVSVKTSGIWGGGFQHVAAVNGNDAVLLGGDVSGMHVTTNSGSSWTPRNVGFEDYRQSRGVVSVAYHPNNNNKAYIATSGGFYKSTDGGASWTRESNFFESSTPRFDAFGSQPRTIGNLIVVAIEGGSPVIYVGSDSEDDRGGIWRSADEGDTWIQISHTKFDDDTVHSLVQHPTTDKLYAAIQSEDGDEGIWEFADCNTARCTAGTLVGSGTGRANPYELVFDSDLTLWCACGQRGVHYAEGPGYSVWANWNNFVNDDPLPVNGDDDDEYVAIAVGDIDGDPEEEVVVGAVNRDDVERSVRWAETDTQGWNDIQPTWAAAKTAKVCNTSRDFWMSENTNTDRNVLGGALWDTGSLIFVEGKLWVIGRTGPWRLEAFGTKTWCPAVRSLSDSANRGIVAGNENNSQYLVASTDFDVLTTKTDFFKVGTPKVFGDDDGVTVGFDVDFNRYNNTTGTPFSGEFGISGTGHRDTPHEEGFVAGFDTLNTDYPTTFTRFDDSDPLLRTLPENAVMGVGTGTRVDNETTFTLAAVHDQVEVPAEEILEQPGGVFVQAGTGPWTEVLAGQVEPVLNQANGFTRVPIEWSREPQVTVEFVSAETLYPTQTSVAVQDTNSDIDDDDLMVMFIGASDTVAWDPETAIGDPTGGTWTTDPDADEYRSKFLGHQGFYRTASNANKGATFTSMLNIDNGVGLDNVGTGFVSLRTNAGTLTVVDVASSSDSKASGPRTLPALTGRGDLDLYFVRTNNNPGTFTWNGATEIATDGWLSIATADPDIDTPPTVTFGNDQGYTAMAMRVISTEEVYDEWVYLLDRDTGLWRAGNYGQGILNGGTATQAWTKLWPAGAASPAASDFPNDFTGFLTVDPSDNDHLYLSTGGKLLEFTNAESCDADTTNSTFPDCAITEHTIVDKFGPIAMDDTGEHLVVASRVENAVDQAELWVRDEDTGNWLNVVCNNDIFDGAPYWWTGMAIGGNDRIMIVSRGLGAIEIQYALEDNQVAC